MIWIYDRLELLTEVLMLVGIVVLVWTLRRERAERASSSAQQLPPPIFFDLGDLSPAEYQDMHVNPWIWTAMRVGGGGVFTTPELARADAVEYVTRSGTHQLCAVDDVHKIIFYRSH